MSDSAPVPRWVPWAFLGLLVLPFWPHWIDFEQVRRGLLLLLCGAVLVALPRLPRVRGETAWWMFVGFLGLAALISIRSLQPWEALYRVAHFGALLVVLRLGGAAAGAIATPLATLLAVASTFGILQRLGVTPIGWYGTALEPVSVFGNLNVGSEWTAVAAMAVCVLRVDRPWLRFAALGLAGSYLVVNGSRSGMIALGAGLIVLLIKRRNITGVASTGAALGGAAIGWLLTLVAAAPPAEDHAAEVARIKRASQTIEVRLQIATSCTQLVAERPLFGFGPGQFQVQYPRVRSDEEIELSSQGRQFASEVRTAHDDWIELTVEGGVPLLLLFAIALFVLQRGMRDKERLLPLFVLLLLMFVRSPLANAPAVVAALLPVAGALPAGRTTAGLVRLRRGLGAAMILLGLLPVMAHSLFAPYPAAVEHGGQPDAACAARAHQWMWWEPRWLQVLALEHLALGNAPAATKAAKMASTLRPHDPQLLVLLGTTLSNEGRYDEAANIAIAGLQLDPANPELRVLLSVCLMLRKEYDEAIEAVVLEPHDTLRAQLRSHFAALARETDSRGDTVGAARCRMEVAFLDTLEALGKTDVASITATTAHVQTFVREAGVAGRQRELRTYVLSAAHYLALSDVDGALEAGAHAKRLGLALPNWQREMLGDKLDPLLEHEVWFEVLRKRGN